MKCSKSLFIILSLVFLAACSMPKPQEKEVGDNGSATFLITTHKAFYADTKLHPSISMTTGKVFTFETCFKDKARQHEIANHEFKIELETGVETFISDPNGCIVWSEVINYNTLAPATYIKWDRKITAHGVQKGSVTSSFAINPWDHQEHPPISLLNSTFREYASGTEAQEALAGKLPNGKIYQRPLWLNAMLIRINEQAVSSQGLHLEVELETTPQFEMVKKNGDRILENVRYGKFDVKLSLIHKVAENQKEIRRRIIKDTEIKSEIKGGSMYITANVVLPQLCTNGQMLLGLRIQAQNAPEQLLPFEGIYTIAECDQIKGSFWGRLKNIAAEKAAGQFRVEEYITDKNLPQTDEKGKPQQDFYQQAKAEIRELLFTNKDMQNRSSFHRTRAFTTTACFVKRQDQKILKAQYFNIHTADGRDIRVETNNDGCLKWDDSIDYYHLDQECWRPMEITISNPNMGMNEKIPLQINPWTSSNFARDLRFTTVDKRQSLCAEGKNQIVIQRFDFDKWNYHYMVDPFLNLRVRKEGVIRVGAKLLRPSLTDSSLTGKANEDLPPGPYLLRLAMVDMTATDLHQAVGKVYYADELPVIIEANGTIAQSVTLETLTVRALGNTNQLLVELIPLKPEAQKLISAKVPFDVNSMIDKIDNLAPSTYKGPLMLSNNNEGATMFPAEPIQTDYIVPALVPEYHRTKQQIEMAGSKFTTKEYTAATLSLDLINLNRGSESIGLRRSFQNPLWWKLSPSKLNHLIPETPMTFVKWMDSKKITPEIAEKFCRYWVYDVFGRPKSEKEPALIEDWVELGQIEGECIAHVRRKGPESVFSVSYRNLLKNISPEVDLVRKGDVRDFNISQSFALSSGTATTSSTSIGVDFGMGLKLFDFFGALGGSTGGKISKSWSWSNSKGQQSSQSIGAGLGGSFEHLQADISAENYEKCVTIKLASPRIRAHFNPKIPEQQRANILSKGLLICKGFLENKRFSATENYYALNQRISATQLLDNGSDMNRPFFMLIRGQDEMSAMMRLLGIQLSQLNSKGIQSDLTPDHIMYLMEHMPPSLPSQYVESSHELPY